MEPAAGFDAFLQHVSSRLALVEAGDPGHSRGTEGTHAAVMVFLRRAPDGAGTDDEMGTAQVLFIKRADREGDPWSGHIAFPGGRGEDTDLTLLDIAIREATEEVGIDARTEGRVLGRLPTLRPRSPRLPPLDVTPFVAAASAGAVVRPQKDEVAEAFWVPLASLRKGRTETVRFEGGPEFPAYPSPRGPIWGITERILTGFMEILGAYTEPSAR